MSDTKKQEKTSIIPKCKTETPGIKDAIIKRHTFGRTEKILRRNRKIWTRLAAKRRRANDKKKIDEQDS